MKDRITIKTSRILDRNILQNTRSYNKRKIKTSYIMVKTGHLIQTVKFMLHHSLLKICSNYLVLSIPLRMKFIAVY